MSNNREEEIRRRAYELWERGGRIGNAEDHWYQAEGEIKRGSSSVDLGVNPALGGISKHPANASAVRLRSWPLAIR